MHHHGGGGITAAMFQCGLVSMLGPGLDSNACTTVAHVSTSLPQLPTCHVGLHCTRTQPQVSSERESTPGLGDSSCGISRMRSLYSRSMRLSDGICRR